MWFCHGKRKWLQACDRFRRVATQEVAMLALSAAKPCHGVPPHMDMDFDNILLKTLDIARSSERERARMFPPETFSDLRLLVAVSAYAVNRGIVSSARSYKEMQTLTRELQDFLETPELGGSLSQNEFAELKEIYLDLARTTCAIGIQHDEELYQLLTGVNPDDLHA